jgi:hypothetical protein
MTSDEIDFEALRLPPSGQLIAKKDVSIIPTRKPKKTEWFRVRPEPEWKIDLPVYEDADMDGEHYIIAPEYLNFLNDQGLVRRVRLYTCYTHGSGVLFLSPVGLPDADGKENSYNRSRHEAYLKAEKEWVRINANKSLGGYDIWTPESPMDEPVWPAVPATLKDALSIAFKGKYINAPDHPILNRLKGKL